MLGTLNLQQWFAIWLLCDQIITFYACACRFSKGQCSSFGCCSQIITIGTNESFCSHFIPSFVRDYTQFYILFVYDIVYKEVCLLCIHIISLLC